MVKAAETGGSRRALSQYLIDQNLVPLGIRERSLSLEEAFVTITGDNVDRFAELSGAR